MAGHNDSELIEKLLESDLWQKKIKDDCIDQKVLFTIRKKRIDLYHKGGLLFTFDVSKGFKTHIKYAAVIDTDEDTLKNYLSESEIESRELPHDYSKGYKRIKENCSNYSGVEAAGVSALYHSHSCFSGSDVVVLDIEVSFTSLELDGSKQDRVDVVLLNKKNGKLQFVEAKHFSNKELWSKSQPPVIKQIKRYEGQILEKRKDIVSKYKIYIEHLNYIFDLALPVPTEIDDRVTLLVFGFDKDQKNGRLSKQINNNPFYDGVKTYQKGDIKDFKMNALWKGEVIKS
jgi:hypothetical protein